MKQSTRERAVDLIPFPEQGVVTVRLYVHNVAHVKVKDCRVSRGPPVTRRVTVQRVDVPVTKRQGQGQSQGQRQRQQSFPRLHSRPPCDCTAS